MIKIQKRSKTKQTESEWVDFFPGDMVVCLENFRMNSVDFHKGFFYEIEDSITDRAGVRIIRINGSWCISGYFIRI